MWSETGDGGQVLHRPVARRQGGRRRRDRRHDPALTRAWLDGAAPAGVALGLLPRRITHDLTVDHTGQLPPVERTSGPRPDRRTSRPTARSLTLLKQAVDCTGVTALCSGLR
jgi:hypothetical protein